MAQEIFTNYEEAFEKLQPNASSYLVIVTRGHKEDMRVLAWAVRTPARYVGMIGSRRKVFSVYKALEKAGYRAEEFERVFAPMGLDYRCAVAGRNCSQHRKRTRCGPAQCLGAAHKKLRLEVGDAVETI